MFWRIRESLSRFMYGRYGFDRLTLVLLILYLIIDIIGNVTWYITGNVAVRLVFIFIMTAVIVFAVYRVLSRDINRRRAELQRYNGLHTAVKNRFTVMNKNRTDPAHKYMICPVCKAMIRFPRKKGVHPANCPRCRALITVKIR